MRRLSALAKACVLGTVLFASVCYAQFSGSIQGTVSDSTGAILPGADLTLTNTGIKVTQSTKALSSGLYRFLSLAPGEYSIVCSTPGFTAITISVTLQTAENRDVPCQLSPGTVAQQVHVSGASVPLIDTSDSRNSYTLDTDALATLPLANRNPTSVMEVTPGVTGGLDLQGNGIYNPEVSIDASANGRSENGNVYIIDGLEVTSNNRGGILTLVPSSDQVQEVAVQPNTFSVQYKGGAGIETIMSTKYGTDKFHGYASWYYTYQNFGARGEFGATHEAVPDLAPNHTNNLSFGLGGPIWRKHKLYFFASDQPNHFEGTTYGTAFFEDPAFTTFSSSAAPNSIGTDILHKYPVLATSRTQTQTAQGAFGPASLGGCETPAFLNIPCSTPVFDSGRVSYTGSEKDNQVTGRLDKYFNKDRIYFGIIRNRQTPFSGAARPAFSSTSQLYGTAMQGNWTHTFNSNTLNEAALGYNRSEGLSIATSDFTVPSIAVGGLGTGFGNGFPKSDYISHTVRWREALTRIEGRHTLKAGYDWYRGDDVSYKAPTHTMPQFTFTNIVDLINDHPYQESNLAYNLITGKPKDANYAYAIQTQGAFVEDTWKLNRRTTVTYGLRYDNFGNAYPSGYGSIATAFHLGSGSTFIEKVSNGYLKTQSHLLDHSLNWIFSPRVGVATDLTGSGRWVLKGGFGIYHEQIILGQQDSPALTNPPNYTIPTFFNNGSTAAPIFALGKSNNYPFGYPYPVFQGAALNSKGGVVGSQVAIGGVDPNASVPLTLNYAATLERELTTNLVASIGYTGSHSSDLLLAEGQQAAYGNSYDVNAFAGDLIQHLSCGSNNSCTGVQTRANTSFGSIAYSYNVNRANYDAFVAAVRGRFLRRGFLTASYTRSVAKDNTYYYFPGSDANRFYGNSAWDAPNRFSLAGNYQFAGFSANRTSRVLTTGWSVSGTFITQSGTPLIVSTSNPFRAILDPNTGQLSFDPSSGDYIASGYNYAFPNVQSNGKMKTSRQAYRSGVFPLCTATTGSNFNNCGPFSLPSFGQGGNEMISGQFRNPGFAQTDATLMRTFSLLEHSTLAFRVNAFNLFNQVNFYPLSTDAAASNFGSATQTHTPRYLQIGATVSF